MVRRLRLTPGEAMARIAIHFTQSQRFYAVISS
jgi:hypothetical protein